MPIGRFGFRRRPAARPDDGAPGAHQEVRQVAANQARRLPPPDWLPQRLDIQQQQQIREMQQGLQGVVDNIFVNAAPLPWQHKPKEEKPPAKLTRALPAGRMRSVKLGDIIKAYTHRNNLYHDHYTMIDFRPVRVKEYYLDNRFNIQQSEFAIVSSKIIIEFIKGKKKQLDRDDFDDFGEVREE